MWHSDQKKNLMRYSKKMFVLQLWQDQFWIFLVAVTLISIVIVLTIYSLFPWYRVQTNSMSPTFQAGDIIIVSRYYYLFSPIKKGDIVLFQPINDIFEEGFWSHRVVATEGDSVEIRNGLVLINGSVLPSNADTTYPDTATQKIQKGVVYQKGDNPDSITGIIPSSDVQGKVVLYF